MSAITQLRGMIVMFAAMACAASGVAQNTPTTALEVKASGQKTFYADSRAGNNQVTVLSESTLEDFTCVCNKVSGQCTFDPKKVESLVGKFSIRVEDIRTGIDLRDEHLRSADWLDAAKNPEVVITIEKVEDVKKSAPNTATMTLVANCALHGKSKSVRIPANLTYLDESPETMKRVKGDIIRIRASFDLKLADYGVTGPAGGNMVGLKVADTVGIKVAVFASTEKPGDDLKADKPATSQPEKAKPPAPKKP